MKEKNLVLITSTFPYGKRESYLENEIEHLSSAFNKIDILVHAKTSAEKRQVPSNCHISELSTANKSSSVFSILSLSTIFSEALYIFRTISPNDWFAALKTLRYTITQIANIYPEMLHFINERSISTTDTRFYTYWLDNHAIVLALLKKNGKINKAISRAHNWDVYFDLHTGNYLPFRRLLAAHLDRIYTISNNAKCYIENKAEYKQSQKISVARLGTDNTSGLRNPDTESDTFILLSCSTLIKRKRIDLIIDAISKLNADTKVIWYHIGEEGDQSQYLQDLITKHASPNHQMILLGHIDNAKLLDFYTSNHIDLFINMSESEGVPVSIMEAYSVGIPAIATNVGGVSEIVNNENGFIVAVNTPPQEVASIITQYINTSTSARQAYRDAAYNTWNNLYNAQKNYTAFVDGVINL